MPSRPRSGTCAQAIDAFSEALRERPDDRVTMNNLFALYNVSCQQVARGGYTAKARGSGLGTGRAVVLLD